MPFEFVCPHCYHKTWVDEAYAGQKGPCANCGRQIILPLLEGSAGKGPRPSPALPIETLPERIQANWWRLKKNWVAGSVVVGLMICLGFGVFLLRPGIERLRSQRDLVQCRNNLQQIAKALQAYNDMHGSYPPPFVADATGKPLYSWRVLILPFLNEQALYGRFNLLEAWDSAANIGLVAEMPKIFASPASPDAAVAGEASYELITGDGTLFPIAGPLSSKDVIDPADQTLLVVEVPTQGRSWLEPGDLDVKKMKLQIGAKGKDVIGGNHEFGATAVMVDGTTVVLPDRLPASTLRALISPDGGEILSDSEWIR